MTILPPSKCLMALVNWDTYEMGREIPQLIPNIDLGAQPQDKQPTSPGPASHNGLSATQIEGPFLSPSQSALVFNYSE